MTPEQVLIEKLAKAFCSVPDVYIVSTHGVGAAFEDRGEEMQAKICNLARAAIRALAEAGCTEGMVLAGSLCTQGNTIAAKACAVGCFQSMLTALLADEEKQG